MLNLSVPETSYSSSEGEDDFYDANDDPFSSQVTTPTGWVHEKASIVCEKRRRAKLPALFYVSSAHRFSCFRVGEDWSRASRRREAITKLRRSCRWDDSSCIKFDSCWLVWHGSCMIETNELHAESHLIRKHYLYTPAKTFGTLFMSIAGFDGSETKNKNANRW